MIRDLCRRVGAVGVATSSTSDAPAAASSSSSSSSKRKPANKHLLAARRAIKKTSDAQEARTLKREAQANQTFTPEQTRWFRPEMADTAPPHSAGKKWNAEYMQINVLPMNEATDGGSRSGLAGVLASLDAGETEAQSRGVQNARGFLYETEYAADLLTRAQGGAEMLTSKFDRPAIRRERLETTMEVWLSTFAANRGITVEEARQMRDFREQQAAERDRQSAEVIAEQQAEEAQREENLDVAAEHNMDFEQRQNMVVCIPYDAGADPAGYVDENDQHVEYDESRDGPPRGMRSSLRFMLDVTAYYGNAKTDVMPKYGGWLRLAIKVGGVRNYQQDGFPIRPMLAIAHIDIKAPAPGPRDYVEVSATLPDGRVGITTLGPEIRDTYKARYSDVKQMGMDPTELAAFRAKLDENNQNLENIFEQVAVDIAASAAVYSAIDVTSGYDDRHRTLIVEAFAVDDGSGYPAFVEAASEAQRQGTKHFRPFDQQPYVRHIRTWDFPVDYRFRDPRREKARFRNKATELAQTPETQSLTTSPLVRIQSVMQNDFLESDVLVVFGGGPKGGSVDMYQREEFNPEFADNESDDATLLAKWRAMNAEPAWVAAAVALGPPEPEVLVIEQGVGPDGYQLDPRLEPNPQYNTAENQAKVAGKKLRDDLRETLEDLVGARAWTQEELNDLEVEYTGAVDRAAGLGLGPPPRPDRAPYVLGTRVNAYNNGPGDALYDKDTWRIETQRMALQLIELQNVFTHNNPLLMWDADTVAHFNVPRRIVASLDTVQTQTRPLVVRTDEKPADAVRARERMDADGDATWAMLKDAKQYNDADDLVWVNEAGEVVESSDEDEDEEDAEDMEQ